MPTVVHLVAQLAVVMQAPTDELQRYTYERALMGAAVKITLYAPQERSANLAADAAFERIAQLDRILSDYKADSELSKLSDTAGSGRAVPLGHDLWTVLERGQRLAERTGGAFDVTVGPFVRLWRRARRNKQFPAADRLVEARAAVGYKKLKLDPERQTAELLVPGMRLDLGGIAAGYAADEAMQVLSRHGITRALIDISGDMLASDPPPGEDGWKIGIAPLDPNGPPSRFIRLCNVAITTSGDAFQHVVFNGKRYSHIVDPATGLGLTNQSSVTVIATDCITADSLATAVSVLGLEKGLRLIDATDEAAGLIVLSRDGTVDTVKSKRFAHYRFMDD